MYVLWNHIHVEIELKKPGNEPTPLQIQRLAEWERAGAVTAVIHSTSELDLLIKQLLSA